MFFVRIFVTLFWNLSSVEVSMHKSIFDLEEDFDSKEELLLYLVTIKQKNKSLPENHFPQEKSYNDYVSFQNRKFGKFHFFNQNQNYRVLRQQL